MKITAEHLLCWIILPEQLTRPSEMGLSPHILVILLVMANEILARLGPVDNACSRLWDYPFRSLGAAQCHYNPNVFSTTPQMAARYNFPIETHTVLTSDGYILTIFRIRSANSTTSGKNSSNKFPIFMQHGILMNSECFTAAAEKSHAFILARAGYDVWLGNLRGTFYSKKNVNFSSKNPKFWNYNLDTLAAIDIRESLRYVGNVTGKAGSINFIGHSMGATIGFMYAAAFPEESRSMLGKIIMLSPVVYLNRIPAAPLLNIAGPAIRAVAILLRLNVLFYHEKINKKMVVQVCAIIPGICLRSLEISFGKTDRFAAEDLLLLLNHAVQAVSRKQLVQYLQFIQTGEFKKFDYGVKKNMQVYGRSTPPLYDLSQVQLPVYLFYGKTDALTIPEAARQVYGELGSNKKHLTQIPVNDSNAPFNHFDFLYSKYQKQDLYPSLFSALDQD